MNTVNEIIKNNKSFNFKAFNIDTYTQALNELKQNNSQIIQNFKLNLKNNVIDSLYDFSNLVSNTHLYLSKTIDLQKSLNSTPEVVALSNNYNLMLVEFFKFYSDKEIYDTLIDFKIHSGYDNLKKSDKYLFDSYINLFENNGVHLDEKMKKEFLELKNQLVSETSSYNLSLQKSRDNISFILSKEELNFISNIQYEPLNNGSEEFVINNLNSLSDLIRTSTNEDLRKRAYDFEKQIGLDNYINAEKILITNQKISNILGYKNASQMYLKNNILNSPDKVSNFLNDIYKQALPKYEYEVNMIERFSLNKLGKPFEYHNLAYLMDQISIDEYNFDHERIKKFFPVDFVLNGMFKLIKNTFGLSAIEVTDHTTTLHPSQKEYKMYHEDDVFAGTILLDLFSRKGKRGGAFCGALTEYSTDINNNITSIPLVYVVANADSFELNTDRNYLKFNDVITLFHEMGHALHHMFSKHRASCLNGTSLVQRDAVETPSQLMELFCYEPDVLKLISYNLDTKKPLSKSDIEVIQKSKDNFSGFKVVRHVLASSIDLEIYSNINLNKSIKDVEQDFIYKLIKLPLNDLAVSHYLESHKLFHIYTAGYNSNLYSYKYSEMLSHDFFDFIKNGDNRKLNFQERSYLYRDVIYKSSGVGDMKEFIYDILERDFDSSKFIKFYCSMPDKNRKASHKIK